MANTNALPIGTLAERTGCNVPTIRYYEEIGLLPRAARSASGHRVYSETDMRHLLFIRRCRDFGFPIEQVRALVTLMNEGTKNCMEARDLAQERLDAVRQKIREMKALERSLSQFVASCNSSCAGGPASACVILEDLASGDGCTSACKPT
jgi:DNA-binding transcriptional MerR regulator